MVDGLRVDHPDGLADPDTYLQRLHEATGGRWTVVEKILADGEQLPASWPMAGTTGYDALRHIDGLFTDPAGFENSSASTGGSRPRRPTAAATGPRRHGGRRTR